MATEHDAREFARRRSLAGVAVRTMMHGRPNAPTVTVELSRCGRDLGSKVTTGRGARARTMYFLPAMVEESA